MYTGTSAQTATPPIDHSSLESDPHSSLLQVGPSGQWDYLRAGQDVRLFPAGPLLRMLVNLRYQIQGDSSGERVRAALKARADRWEQGGGKPADLYRGARLAEALRWVGEDARGLSPQEHRFLNASFGLQVAGYERTRRRQSAWFSWLVLGMCLLALLSLVELFAWQRAAQQGHYQYQRYLIAESQAVSAERPLLGLRLAVEALAAVPSPDSPLFARALENLQELARRGQLARLASDVKTIFPLQDGSAFVASTFSGDGKLWPTTNSQPVPLSGRVRNVYFSPQAPFFVVSYDNGFQELRRIDTGAVMPLTGDFERTFFDLKQSFFAVRHANNLSDLGGLEHNSTTLDRLGLSNGQFVYNPDQQRIIVLYADGSVYLLDVKWLMALGEDPASLSAQELVQIACEGPLRSELWSPADQRALDQALAGEQARACR